MPAALVIAVGSRGDTEPLIALSTALLHTPPFTSVHLLLQPDYLHLAPAEPGLAVHPLPFAIRDFTRKYYLELLRALLHRLLTCAALDDVRLQRDAMAAIEARVVAPALPALLARARPAAPAAILTSYMAAPAAACLADLLAVPLVLVNFQPRTPTALYPDFMASPAAAHAAGRAAAAAARPASSKHALTYHAGLDADARALPALNAFRASAGLPPLTPRALLDVRHARAPHAHVLNAFPAQLVPPSPDWGPRVAGVPPLAAGYAPRGWAPARCPAVAAFLACGAPPALVTLGSMARAAHAAAVEALLGGLRAAGAPRVLVLGGLCAPRDPALRRWCAGRVLATDEAPPFAWLLPRVGSVVCHGGAGTVSAAARAGRPVVVAHVFYDQCFWAGVVEAAGVGADAGPLASLTAAGAEAAVRAALTPPVRRRAAQIGAEMRAEPPGAAVAACLIARIATATPDAPDVAAP